MKVHEPSIDRGNILCFKLLDHIRIASENETDKEKLTMLLNELTLFIHFHFRAEERLMLDAGYEGYDNHHAAHVNCMESLKDHMFDFSDDKIEEGAILDFTEEWLLKHISSHDRKFGFYMFYRASCASISNTVPCAVELFQKKS